MSFDLAKRKQGFDSFLLHLMRNTKYDPQRPMGNVAATHIGDIALAWIVGLHSETAPLLPRYIEWIDHALDKDENFGTSRYFHRRTLNWAKGLGLWMQSGTNDPEVWACAQDSDLAAFQLDTNVWPEHLVGTQRLDDFLAFCVQAGNFDAGILEYEKHHPCKLPNLKKRLYPRDLAYALCRQDRELCFDEGDLFAAGKGVIGWKLGKEWLEKGQYIRAATWLKIVYTRHDASLSPLNILRKSHDHLADSPQSTR